MLAEDLPEFKRLAQLLRASATLEAQDGRMDQAVHSIDMGFKLVKHLEDEPMFTCQLVRIAILAITSRSLRDALAYGDMSETQARRLFDTVGQIDAARGFVRAWQGERVYFVRLSCLSDLPAIVGNTSAGGRGGFAAHVLRKALGLFYGSLLRGDQAAYLRFAARQLDGVNLSYREAKSNGLFEEEQNLPFYAIISKIGAGIDARMGMSRYSFEAQAAGAQVFLALQAYKYRHGSYPKTLDELKAKLGWKLPKDPFSGRELVYKRQDKGFLLYSTGPDLKDDGGKELDHYLMPTKPGDIVWKWER